MSILNTADIEQDISFIENGYGAALHSYGENGASVWTAVNAALLDVGLKYSQPTTLNYNRAFGAPEAGGYNFDELTQYANNWLYNDNSTLYISIEWFTVSDDILKIIGKYWEIGTDKPTEIQLYFSITKITGNGNLRGSGRTC